MLGRRVLGRMPRRIPGLGPAGAPIDAQRGSRACCVAVLRVMDRSPDGKLSVQESPVRLVPPPDGTLRWMDLSGEGSDMLERLRTGLRLSPARHRGLSAVRSAPETRGVPRPPVPGHTGLFLPQ